MKKNLVGDNTNKGEHQQGRTILLVITPTREILLVITPTRAKHQQGRTPTRAKMGLL
jgi:hypothetical protein